MLVFRANMLKLDLTSNKGVRLMDTDLEIRCWPEAAAGYALEGRRNSPGIPSDMTREMLEAGIRNSGLESVLEHVLSTDRVTVFKTDRRVYQMGVDALGLKREEILFPAFAGWDAAGAKAFG
jgi:2-haloacid dehalogenase